ncbi:MAG: hypothetical protein WCF18_18440 [Chthoniobacteraceae bacterium]
MKTVFVLTGLLLGMLCVCRAEVTLSPEDSAPLRFAAAEIGRAAKDAHQPVPDVSLSIVAGAAQGYRIERDGAKVRVIGGDAAGAMYGGLEVAEAARIGTLADLPPGEHRPHIEFRGIKFNIPLDLRTPSYSDNATASQANIPEVWSREFWREYFDEMARQRFNVISLWNLHPFPSIVKVPEYPDVALADVLRAKAGSFDDSYSHSGKDMFRPELLKDAEVVKRMSIEEKIAFWRDLMQMAKDRGVEVYWFTWNTFLFGAEGKDGLSRAKLDENMIRYFRASVRETVTTYPLLAGIGITAGENMSAKMGGLTKEQWLWQTYGEGIRDGLKDTPARPFRLIHRLHETDINEIRTEWKDYPGVLDYSYKYAVAHMYASTRPKFIDPLLAVLPKDPRTWLTVRNDDVYSFRWGDPDFAREFITKMPGADVVRGFYIGPDGYCWGREAMDKDPTSPRQFVMQKQWFSFMLWGRLSYDPTLTDAHFEKVLAAHFPGVPADRLLASWSAASRVFPEITRFFWGNIDVKWLPEACLSHPKGKGFYTVQHFVEGETMPGEANINIREWRHRLETNASLDGVVTPPQVAANLRRDADDALAGAAEISKFKSQVSDSKELRQTLGDIEAFAHIGRYYAAKIEAACELALFDSAGKAEHQSAAIAKLEEALGHWRAYAAAYTRQYEQPLLYNRVGWVDIPKLAEKAAADIEIARQWKPGSVKYKPQPAKKGGIIFGQ